MDSLPFVEQTLKLIDRYGVMALVAIAGMVATYKLVAKLLGGHAEQEAGWREEKTKLIERLHHYEDWKENEYKSVLKLADDLIEELELQRRGGLTAQSLNPPQKTPV